jgi:hypothetical protein
MRAQMNIIELQENRQELIQLKQAHKINMLLIALFNSPYFMCCNIYAFLYQINSSLKIIDSHFFAGKHN